MNRGDEPRPLRGGGDSDLRVAEGAMETREFWEERERRFRALASPARRGRALYVERDSLDNRLAELGAHLLAIIPPKLGGLSAPVDASIPLEVVYERARFVASAGIMKQRLQNGEYLPKWHIAVEHPHSSRELDRIGADVVARFRAEAEIAARAAEIVAGSATPEEAVDTWLDRVRRKPHEDPAAERSARASDRDLLICIPDFISASATLCMEFAAESCRFLSGAPVAGRGVQRQLIIQPKLDAKGWSPSRWAKMAGVDKSVPIDFLSGKTHYLRRETRNSLAEALGVPLTQFPE